MRDLKIFQGKVETYRKNAPTPHTQKELAEAIPLDKDELSKRLNAYKHRQRTISPLTCAQVQAIVRTLARWGAIETEEQAKDLLDLMECPHYSASDWKTSPLNLLQSVPASPMYIQSKSISTDIQSKEKQLARLRAMVIDHSGFLHTRLESFVGRQKEVAEIRHHISTMLLTGGYITITGQAGQGKSSIIAKLVEKYGPGKTAHHFIPFNPGPDYQVSLLHDLMGRLVLKHDLPDWYVASESRPTLRDYFPKVLTEIAAEGKQEVIFIDGLDQLRMDIDGERDLSFLPNTLPQGIVFVLGTRPDDTFHALELRKPHHKYVLPNISRQDFDLIMDHREVSLDSLLVDQFYQAMQANALYLDQVAKELAHERGTKPEEIIKSVAANPENIFSLSIARLKRHSVKWREALRPLLGILLAAREPLSIPHLRQILRLDDDQLRDGLVQLGGLIADDGRQRYSLYHLKLYDYLRQEENNLQKGYVFAIDEEEDWHKKLADWCEGDNIQAIWEDTRRDLTEQKRKEYARHHYITHLYYARELQRLFRVLDEGEYGRAKVRYDPSTFLYARDLGLGRRVASWDGESLEEGVELLPRLWRYTLLQCSLASRADNYPPIAFGTQTMLKREQKSLSLAELLTDPVHKTEAFLEIAKQMAKQEGLEQECIQTLLRARETAYTIQKRDARTRALIELEVAFAQAQQWEQADTLWFEAESMIRTIAMESTKEQMLRELIMTLAQAQQWERAEAVTRFIPAFYRAQALRELNSALIQAQQWRRAEGIILMMEKDAQVDALGNLGIALAEAQLWEQAEEVWTKAEAAFYSNPAGYRSKKLAMLIFDLQLAQQWNRMERIILTIENNQEKVQYLGNLGIALAEAQLWEQAEEVWAKAEAVIQTIKESNQNAGASIELDVALGWTTRWEITETILRALKKCERKAEALTEQKVAFAKVQRERYAGLLKLLEHDSSSHFRYHDPSHDLFIKLRELKDRGQAFERTQQWEHAIATWGEVEAVIHRLEKSSLKTELLAELSMNFARAQHWERAEAVWAKAEKVIHTIEKSDWKAWALAELSSAFARARQWEHAKAVIHTIEKIKEKVRKWDDEGKSVIIMYSWALAELSAAFARARQWKHAKAVIRTIEESDQKERALAELGLALAQAQHWEQAEAVIHTIKSWQKNWALAKLGIVLAQSQQWEQAERVIRAVREKGWKAWALAELSTALAQAQQWEQAEMVIHTIEKSNRKVTALAKLGEALMQVQQREQAKAIWREAEEVIHTVERSGEKAIASAELGIVLARAQQWEQAKAIWREAEEVIHTVERSGEKVKALGKLSTTLVQAQQWKQAEAIIHTIEESDQKVRAFAELGMALAQAQQLQWANAVWKEAEEVAYTIQDGEKNAKSLRMAAEFINRAGAYEQVLHLTQRAWLQANTRMNAIHLFPLALGFIPSRPEIGTAFCEAFAWVDTF